MTDRETLKSQHDVVPDAKPVRTDERKTREEWLEQAIDAFRPWFDKYAGVSIPEKIRVSVGIPTGGSSVIGQTWYDGEDEVPIIYISPALTDEARVLDVLVHELVHAALGRGYGHLKEFRHAAEGIGLTGKMTATVAGPLLSDACAALARELGVYDHASHTSMTATGTGRAPKGDGPKPGADVPRKQGTRMKRLEATDCCGYLVRTTRKWLEQGLPTCPHGSPLYHTPA